MCARRFKVLALFGLLLAASTVRADNLSLPVFPGAAGFGTGTPAGSGRHLAPPSTAIRIVSNLNDSGTGSLRDCVRAAGPRTCLFEVAGAIRLNSELLIESPYLTIAGQSAPSPGILLFGAGVRVATHDVLIQHLQIRVGDSKTGPKPETRDALVVAGKGSQSAKNVVLDHLSLSWAVDENFDVWYGTSSDVTLSNSIVAEGLYKSIHPKGPHSMGVLIGDGVKRVSLHGNLIANNYDRNPRLKPGSQLEFINNVVYGWGGSSSWNEANISDSDGTGIATELAFIGNYYRPGPWSPAKATVYGKPAAAGSRVYVVANYGPTRTTQTVSEWKISSLAESPFRAQLPTFSLSGILPTAPEQTLTEVLTHAGARPKDSNAADRRVISEVTFRTGSLKDCVSGCKRSAGGFPNMPKTVRTLSLPENPLQDDDGNGYTNLEDWLSQLSNALE